MSGADIIRACRDQSVFHPVRTEVALAGNISIRIKFNGIVWTCVCAQAASGAFLVIQDNNAVISVNDCRFRTHLDTGRLITVSAETDTEHELRISIYHSRAVFQDLDEPDALRGMVFLFAGHLAGPASPAGFVIDNQCEGIHLARLLGSSLRADPA